jgi:hypothetical protein
MKVMALGEFVAPTQRMDFHGNFKAAIQGWLLVVGSRPIFAGRDWLLYGKEFDSMDIGYVPKPDRQLWTLKLWCFYKSPAITDAYTEV